jgi:hypothetical protein
MHKATQYPRVRDNFLLIGNQTASFMVVHNKLEVRVVTGIVFGNFTAFLTIICHEKSNYFFSFGVITAV